MLHPFLRRIWPNSILDRPRSIKAVIDTTPDPQTSIHNGTTFIYRSVPFFIAAGSMALPECLGITSDPGPAECLPFARRALIGDSGQKTQGFLAKLGLTRSYHAGERTRGCATPKPEEQRG